MKTHHDIIDDFRAAMRDAGIETTAAIIGDGVRHRIHITGQKSGTLNGAYILHLDGKAAGYFEDFQNSIKANWKSDIESKPLSNAERRKFAQQRATKEAEQQQQTAASQKRAAERALWVWEHSKEITNASEHPYLITKKIQAHGARLYRGALIYRLFDVHKNLVGIRFIHPDGNKRPLKGALKTGAFGIIGKVKPGDTLLIAEGFSTAASLHEASGHPVFIATDCGNLSATAKAVRALYPNSKIIVCGDNDESNQGEKYAVEAARTCKGFYIIPPDAGTDFNDLLTEEVNDEN
ncbi:MAG: toprim domain-containing protein [Methylobacter sp.]|nr:toprim domain-containing protein [Methylobacter sp.]